MDGLKPGADGAVSAAPSEGVLLSCDDTFDGFLTAVFESYAHRPPPAGVVGGQFQHRLGMGVVPVETDEHKAARVIDGICRVMKGDAYRRVWQGFLSADPEKSTVIYRYIRLGMHVGEAVHRLLTDERVAAMDKLVRLVGRESSHQTEFLRFSRLEGGVFYAEMQPENDVLPLLMPFFTDRFNSQPFLIHDTGRQTAGVYDTRTWYITDASSLTLPGLSGDEKEYRRLWKRFYDTVAIRERVNPALRRQLMPKKYWRYITELTTPDDAPPTALPSDISRAAANPLTGGETPRLLPSGPFPAQGGPSRLTR